MKRQKEMEETMSMAHKQFMTGLQQSLEVLDKEIREAGEMTATCTDEWCNTTESYIDELHKQLYAISEPRWLPAEDSKKISNMRKRIKQMYVDFHHLRENKMAA